jgi:hypothetical protein
MEHIVRTVYSASLQTNQLLGLPTVIKEHSTLNEKFNIHQDVVMADIDKPTLKYITIGNGGHRMVMGTNNIYIPQPIQHTPRHAALYNHLPFVLRLPLDDLAPSERIKYRLRRLETHDGVVYVAYYLKVLDVSATITQLELRNVTDGITTSTAFVPTIADLNPTPPPLTPGGVISTTGDYISATAKVPFLMTTTDIAEFLNVANIIYGDVNYGIISEVGLCSGIDKNLMGNFNGVSSSYTDAIGVQIVSFINTFFATNFANDELRVLFDIGSTETMLNLS